MKKERKSNLQDLFIEDANITEELLISLCNTLVSFAKDSSDLASHVKKTIELENKQDGLREEIINKMFGKDVMVFSREDRLKLIQDLDVIGDIAERTARRIDTHKPKKDLEICNGLEWIAGKLRTIASELKLLIINIFEDFDKAKINIANVNHIRAEIRDNEYKLLKHIYEVKFELYDFMFLNDIIKLSASIANTIEEFSDNMTILICKYTL